MILPTVLHRLSNLPMNILQTNQLPATVGKQFVTIRLDDYAF